MIKSTNTQVHIQELSTVRREEKKSPVAMGADVTGTNKRQIASAHGQTEGASHSREVITAGPSAQEESWRRGEEAAGLHKEPVHSPRLTFPSFAKIQVTFEPKPLTEFFHNLQQINRVPFSCRGMK